MIAGALSTACRSTCSGTQRNQNNRVLRLDYHVPVAAKCMHWIAWLTLLTFRPACFRWTRLSKVEALPAGWPLYVRRQTPLLPAFPKDGIRWLAKYQIDRFCFGRELVPPLSSRGLQPRNALTDRTFCVQSDKDHQRCTHLKFFKPGARSSRESPPLFR